MHILLTNDDGIFTPSIAAMYKQLCKIATVTVVAPSQGQSGASHSISLSPITCDKVDITGKFTGYSVQGSPVDCVKLGILELCSEPVDLVVSGINFGANVGIHVHYSGTVGAAMEGAFSGIPSIAVSATFEKEMDFDISAEYALKTIESILPLTGSGVVNINIPPLAKGKPKGVKVVPHTTNIYEETYLKEKDEYGHTRFVYTSGSHTDKDAVTDITALLDGYITVTALHFNMNDVEKNKELENTKWLWPDFGDQ
jgi:5'-nucleotidase